MKRTRRIRHEQIRDFRLYTNIKRGWSLGEWLFIGVSGFVGYLIAQVILYAF